MGYTLVINPEITSKKYALFGEGTERFTMRFEQSPKGFEICAEINGSRQKCEGVEAAEFTNALEFFIEAAVREKHIEKKEDIVRACIRIVAPGTFFQEHRTIDGAFVRKLRAAEEIAPLHIPLALREIRYVEHHLPHAEMVSASDSAFHKGMPTFSRNYAIPREDSGMYDIHRFGYHGISLTSVLRQAPHVFKDAHMRLIVCHIGSSVSVSAINDGASFDTSAGFGPGEGLIMGTSTGDIEGGALLSLMKEKHMRPYDAQMYLNAHAGLYALAGNRDLRTILERRERGDHNADAALLAFLYQIRKRIGSYIAGLGGVDALILTGTACERNPRLRSLLLRGLDSLGIFLDAEKNDLVVGKNSIISSRHSPIDVAVIRTDELEVMCRIAEDLVP
jgi:acetate kinase